MHKKQCKLEQKISLQEIWSNDLINLNKFNYYKEVFLEEKANYQLPNYFFSFEINSFIENNLGFEIA